MSEKTSEKVAKIQENSAPVPHLKREFPLSCVIMAAGVSQRFQKPINGTPDLDAASKALIKNPDNESSAVAVNIPDNVSKLLVDFKGKPLLLWTLDCFAQLGCCSRIVVVRRHDTENIVPKDSFRIIWNNGKNLSPSITIRQALLAVPDDSKGCLFAVGDQPFLTYSSIYRLCEMFQENPENIISLSWKHQRGNPVIFPRSLFPELLNLEDGLTGRFIIDRHPELLLTVEADCPDELMDIDTREQFINACKGNLLPTDPF